ncbi:hypothetical protein SEA_MUFASA8_84 [Arthrobacter phage Mufasa8]|uniref:Uncharacterized protein n=1 Tax=Arthrobacter phage Mufasa8 TaxID=2656526 RepID=A0A649VNL6_9CAUD|nr:hypothetical protein HYQ08_gp084 [Arthrobacter phage Mufasa8]QGJ93532.1 hypothetical protein SEA_MUFASA8_84 [Arthrobacter phage Mufasa8]
MTPQPLTQEFKANPGTGPSYQPVATIEGIMTFMEEHLRRAKTIQDSVDRAVDIITAAQPVGKGVFLTIHLDGTVSAFATGSVEAKTMLVHRETAPPPVGRVPALITTEDGGKQPVYWPVTPPRWVPGTHYPTGAPMATGGDLGPSHAVTPQRPIVPMNEYADSATLMAAVIASAN